MTKISKCFMDNPIANDFFYLMVGKKLGEGIHRTVYLDRLDESAVIKFETRWNEAFANVSEWQIWNEVRNNHELKKWFAPCISISPSGNVLVQRYAADLHKSELPKKVPEIFYDMKPENWGMYKGHPVARDYANHGIYHRGLRKTKMTKVCWDR
jgi:hypothetical protein